jgi:trans-AT polyketide synthase/acyltransferase/oxidoreductase domain-containing protein
MALIYMFPGQGSQAKGMGEGLFERFPELVQQADAVLGYSLRELCLTDAQEQLGQTQYTQPALYAVNALSYLAKVAETGRQPDYLIGHSLGEYDALFAAGAFDFVTGLRLVQRRGAIMSKAQGGGMAAVLGMEAAAIAQALAAGGCGEVDIANYNAPTQTVISGPKAAVEAAAKVLEQAGAKRVVLLNVSGAFHSRQMAAAAQEFASFVRGCAFQPLQRPVIANLTAREYQPGQVADNLVQQIDHSVRWVETIQYLKTQPDAQFEEVGPGKVLTGLLRQMR